MRDGMERRTRSAAGPPGDKAPQRALVKIVSGDPAGSPGAIAHKIGWNGSDLVADDERVINVFGSGSAAQGVASFRPDADRWVLEPTTLVIGVTIADDSATTATVDSRPVGMSAVPGESGGSVSFENPSDITIPEDGAKAHLVYQTRGGTKQWELVAISVADDASDPPATPALKSVYIGQTHATDIHVLGGHQNVTIYIDNSSVTVSCYNPLMKLPPQTWVVVAWVYEPLTSGGEWTIIGTNFTGLLGKAYTTYAKGETAGEVILYKNTTTSFLVNLTGVAFPFGGVAGGEWVSVTFNGWIWYAESKECDS